MIRSGMNRLTIGAIDSSPDTELFSLLRKELERVGVGKRVGTDDSAHLVDAKG